MDPFQEIDKKSHLKPTLSGNKLFKAFEASRAFPEFSPPLGTAGDPSFFISRVFCEVFSEPAGQGPILRFRGPGRRSLGARREKRLEKVSRARGPESLKKVSKKVRKVKKNHFQTFFLTFGPFSRLFWTFGTPGPGDFFETFLRLFGFGPRDSFSQVHGTSRPIPKNQI